MQRSGSLSVVLSPKETAGGAVGRARAQTPLEILIVLNPSYDRSRIRVILMGFNLSYDTQPVSG